MPIGCRPNHDPATMAVRALASDPARIVWLQVNSAEQTGTNATFRIMGWDSADGHGERIIIGRPAYYAKPMLTRDGCRVVFSDLSNASVWLVNWDGSGLKKITDGFAIAVWQDRKTGNEWIYTGVSITGMVTRVQNLRRHLLEQPEIHEQVWNRTHLDPDNFQLSADGRYAAAIHPWPHCGILELPNGEIHKYGTGCWPSLAPDNSRLFWFFDGAHRNLTICDPMADQRWVVPIDQAPGIDGYEVYHPRWSSHPRFMVMTGPYKVGDGENRIRGGGPEVEIYLGRFAADFKTIEQWARITRNTKADFAPDAWIPFDSAIDAPQQAVAPIHNNNLWPGNRANLVFLWENRDANNEIQDAATGIRRICRVEPSGRAHYGRCLEMNTAGGAFLAEDAGQTLLDACLKTYQLSMEIVLTPRHLQQTGPASIIAYASTTNHFNILLAQNGEELVLRVRSSATTDDPWLPLAKLNAGVPHHLVISLRPGAFTCYLNGRRTFETNRIRPAHWAPHPITFGDISSGNANWQGALEGVAFYARWIETEEASRKYALYAQRFKDRPPTDRLEIEARAITATRIPAPYSIAPYRRALAVNRYAVKNVLAGSYTNSAILVAHWVIMDGAQLNEAIRATDATYRMILEPFDDHPELEGERLLSEQEDMDIPLYYEINP